MEKAKTYPWEQHDESLVLETPEQTQVEYRLATFGARILAAFIDRLVIFLGIVVLIVFALILAGGLGALNEQLGGYALALVILLYFLLTLFYYAIGEVRGEGRTWGKRRLRLRTVMATGQGVTIGASLIRNLARVADDLPLMWIVPSFTSGRRRMGDLLAGTFVIDESTPRASPRRWLSALAPSYGQLAERQYHFTGEMARGLYPDDLNLIEYLEDRLTRQSRRQRQRLLREVALRYADRLQLDDHSRRIAADPKRFLQELALFLRDRFDEKAY